MTSFTSLEPCVMSPISIIYVCNFIHIIAVMNDVTHIILYDCDIMYSNVTLIDVIYINFYVCDTTYIIAIIIEDTIIIF